MPAASSLVVIAALGLAYLLGSVPFAVVVSKLFGLSDPRTYGSKNPGATNVLRSGNKAAAVLTLLGDAAKGWLAVFLAQRFSVEYGLSANVVALVGLAAFVGHLYPVFLKFKGGKGVATAAGVLLALNIWLGLAVLATWIVIAFTLRYSSLAARIAAAAAPIYAGLASGFHFPVMVVGIMSMALIGKHWGNLQRLLAGTEPRLGKRP
jgi:acyl phosphate:glycerol-3-phosphate acyltransferase